MKIYGLPFDVVEDPALPADVVELRDPDGSVVVRIVDVGPPPPPPLAMMISTRPEDWAPRAREILFGRARS